MKRTMKHLSNSKHEKNLRHKRQVYLVFMILSLGVENIALASPEDDCSGLNQPAYQDEYQSCLSRVRNANNMRANGVDCVNCYAIQREQEDPAWLRALGIVAQPLAMVGIAGLGFKYANMSQEAWANSVANGQAQCTSRFNSYLNYSTSVGANPITTDQAGNLMSCGGGSLVGGAYAGMNGLAGNGYGGFGAPGISAGYSPGFMAGMMGPNMGYGANAGGQFGVGLGLPLGVGLAGMLGLGLMGPGIGIQGSINGQVGMGIPGVSAYGQMGMPGMPYGQMGVPGMYGQMGMPGININGSIGLPTVGVQGQIGMPGVSAYGQMGMPGMPYGQMGVPGMNGQIGMPGININGNIGLPTIGINGNAHIGTPGFNPNGSIGMNGAQGAMIPGMTGYTYGPNGQPVYTGSGLSMPGMPNGNGYIGTPGFNPNGSIGINGPQGAMMPGMTGYNYGPNGNGYIGTPGFNPNGSGGMIYGPGIAAGSAGMANWGMPNNGGYWNGTGGWSGPGAYGQGYMGANGYNNNMSAMQAMQGQAMATQERAQGNAYGANMANQGLYNNFASARTDYYGQGGAGYSMGNMAGQMGVNGSFGGSVGFGFGF